MYLSTFSSLLLLVIDFMSSVYEWDGRMNGWIVYWLTYIYLSMDLINDLAYCYLCSNHPPFSQDPGPSW